MQEHFSFERRKNKLQIPVLLFQNVLAGGMSVGLRILKSQQNQAEASNSTPFMPLKQFLLSLICSVCLSEKKHFLHQIFLQAPEVLHVKPLVPFPSPASQVSAVKQEVMGGKSLPLCRQVIHLPSYCSQSCFQ